MVVTSLVENGAGGWKMDKKPTDKEIVKALEDCINHNESCSSCPSNKFCDKHDSKFMMKATLDLINRLQKADEKNKDSIRLLQLAIDQKRRKIIRLEEDNQELKAEVESLEAENKDLIKDNQSLKAENEELHKKYDDTVLLDGNIVQQVHELLITAKAEAYKEFAERLKKSIKKSVDDAWHNDGNGIYDAECVLDDIDNLLKELVGDNNA